MKDKILKTQEKLFDYYIYLSYIAIFASFFGLSYFTIDTTYLDKLVKVYISLFLIWRFSPYNKNKSFSSLDSKIAFNAGIFMLATTFLDSYIQYTKHYFKHLFKKDLNHTKGYLSDKI